MGVEKHRLRRQFDLYDLGLLTGPSLKGATIVVETVKGLLKTSSAAFVVFDAMERLVLIRAKTFPLAGDQSYPLHRSALLPVEDGGFVLALKDLSKEAPSTAEATDMKMNALLASAVFGPDEKPIGALVAFDAAPRIWSELDVQNLGNLAYLITQEVTLHASFATLELMSVEKALPS